MTENTKATNNTSAAAAAAAVAAAAAATPVNDSERRLKVRRKRAEKERARNQDLYPGINDLSDAMEAMPMDVVKHFTLLQEIDAKCILTMPELYKKMDEFYNYPVDSDNEEINKNRSECLQAIRTLIRDLIPSQEEKMHVAGVCAEMVQNYVKRVDHDFDLIENNEIPEYIRYGPVDHPAIVSDSKQTEQAKNVQTTRSESRREAVAAKKAQLAEKSGNNSNRDDKGSSNGRSTPVNGTGNKKPGPKPKKPNTPQPANAQLSTTSSSKKRQRGEANEDEESISRPGTPNGATTASKRRNRNTSNNKGPKDEDKEVYCYCQQVSFGDMVGCDGPDCKLEWFHLSCIGLASPPKGQWYCDECAIKNRRKR